MYVDLFDFLLGTANQGELRDVLVDQVKGDCVSSIALGVGINDTHPESSLQVVVRDLEVSSEDVLVPVVLHSCRGLASTW